MAEKHRFPPKSPNGVLDYTFDFTDWLPAGDEITSVLWSSSPSGLTIQTPTNTASTATAFQVKSVQGLSALRRSTTTPTAILTCGSMLTRQPRHDRSAGR